MIGQAYQADGVVNSMSHGSLFQMAFGVVESAQAFVGQTLTQSILTEVTLSTSCQAIMTRTLFNSMNEASSVSYGMSLAEEAEGLFEAQCTAQGDQLLSAFISKQTAVSLSRISMNQNYLYVETGSLIWLFKRL